MDIIARHSGGRVLSMRRIASAATFCLVISVSGSAVAADLTWEVESPFRFFKPSSSFAPHENAFRSLMLYARAVLEKRPAGGNIEVKPVSGSR
jgi:hypothetical protein